MAIEEKDAQLLQVLERRFAANMHRHVQVAWPAVHARLVDDARALRALHRMEATGGEPDVIGISGGTGPFVFADCAAESPVGRRSTCYDGEARNARKENRPETSALEMAAGMGATLLTEAQYRQLQALQEVDLKTSSWVLTPPDMRALGGALFCDRRYGQVFTYHNGVQSYYAGRGFRCWVPV